MLFNLTPFNVAAIFGGVIPTYGVLLYAINLVNRQYDLVNKWLVFTHYTVHILDSVVY